MKKDVINYIWTDKKRTIFGLPISFTRYFLTEDKFITRKGFLSIEEDELDLYRVIDKKACPAVRTKNVRLWHNSNECQRR